MATLTAQQRLDNSSRVGNGDSRIQSTGSPLQAAYYQDPAHRAQLLSYDQQVSKDLGVPLNQLTQQNISDYNAEVAARQGGFWTQTVMNKVVPAAVIGILSAGAGSAAGAALGGGTGGAIGGGAIGGATGSTLNSAYTGAPLTAGSVAKGAGMGALGAGIASMASPVTQGMVNSGVNPALSSAITRGAIGSGMGALGSALTGGNPANGAIAGGIGGAAAGATGSLSGSPTLGNAAGTIAGSLAGKYLTSPNSPSTPGMPTAASAMPSLPGTTSQQGVPVLPGAGAGPTTGLGYAPHQQTNYSNIDFSKYGQGPEASFYTSNANRSPYPQNIGSYSGYSQPRTTQSGVTPQNST